MFGNKKLFVLLALLVAILLVAACQQAAPTAAPEKEAATAAPAETVAETPAETEGPAPAAEEMRPYRFVAVVHGQASDPFWSVVKNGFDAAAKDMRVKVEYQAPGTFDMVEMSQLIDAAVASKPDGLIVSIPDPDALGESIRGAVDAGIPVFSINSGSDVAKSLGVIAHVGQTEYEAGYGGGQRMAAAGIKKAICVNQEVGNVALDLRCQGFADALAEHGIESSVIAVELADPTESQQRVMAALTSDPDVDGVLTLAYMNRQSLELTLSTGQTHFWSRSRQELWHKGATSGNYQDVVELRIDCDEDAILVLVHPRGPACHTGEDSCFYRALADR